MFSKMKARYFYNTVLYKKKGRLDGCRYLVFCFSKLEVMLIEVFMRSMEKYLYSFFLRGIKKDAILRAGEVLRGMQHSNQRIGLVAGSK